MIFLLRYILGFVKLKVSGSEVEKFLNITALNRIKLWDLKYIKKSIEGYISVHSFKKLREVVKGYNFKIHIIEKRGLPFKTSKYKYRYGILIGICLFFFILFILNEFIWIIDVKGNEKIKESVIIDLCKREGVFIGAHKDNVDTVKKAQKIILENSQLTWTALNIEGCILTVDVKESNYNKDKNNIPSNLKAECDGVITKIDIISGTSLVKVGDVVVKGDVLISGINEGVYKTEYVKSKGEVIAKTEITYKEFAPKKEMVKEKTGKKQKRYTLSFFGVSVPLYLEKNNKDFISYKNIRNLKLFEKNMPISIFEEKMYFIEETKMIYSEETLIKALNDRINEKINNVDFISCREKNYNQIIDENGVTVEKTVVFEKNIAKEENIIINTIN